MGFSDKARLELKMHGDMMGYCTRKIVHKKIKIKNESMPACQKCSRLACTAGWHAVFISSLRRKSHYGLIFAQNLLNSHKKGQNRFECPIFFFSLWCEYLVINVGEKLFLRTGETQSLWLQPRSLHSADLLQQ